MGKVDKEEMVQWLQAMMSLDEEWARIIDRIFDSLEKGVTEFREVLAEGKLPALLEKIRKMPIPEELTCKRVKQAFEAAIEEEINAATIAADYAGGSFMDDEHWRLEYASRLRASVILVEIVEKDFGSLLKKYQI